MKVAKWDQIMTIEALATLKEMGKLIQFARQRRKMSSTELGRRVGVDRRTIANLEVGHPGVSMGVFMQVLSVLNLITGLVEALKPEHDLEAIAVELRRARRRGHALNKISAEEVNF